MTNQIEMIRTYKTPAGVVGAVYNYAGRKCSTFLGKVDDALSALKSALAVDNRSDEEKIIETGNLWENYGKRRVYFNDLADHVFTHLSYYKSGNVSCAEVGGELISNNKAKKIIGELSWGKVWFDLDSGEWETKGLSEDLAEKIIESIKNDVL